MNDFELTIIYKYIEINEKTNSLVKLMKSYPDIIENFNLHYANQIVYKTQELDDFKEEINQRQQHKNWIENNNKHFCNLSFKIRNNMKEYKSLKKSI